MKLIVYLCIFIIPGGALSQQAALSQQGTFTYNYGGYIPENSGIPSSGSSGSPSGINETGFRSNNLQPLDYGTLDEQTKNRILENSRVMDSIAANQQAVTEYIHLENPVEEFIAENNVEINDYNLTLTEKAKIESLMSSLDIEPLYPNKDIIDSLKIQSEIYRFAMKSKNDFINFYDYTLQLIEMAEKNGKTNNLVNSIAYSKIAYRFIRAGTKKAGPSDIYPYLYPLANVSAPKKLKNSRLDEIYRILNALPENKKYYNSKGSIKNVGKSALEKADRAKTYSESKFWSDVGMATLEQVIGLIQVASVSQSITELAFQETIFGKPLTAQDCLVHAVNIFSFGSTKLLNTITANTIKASSSLIALITNKKTAAIISKNLDDTYAFMRSIENGLKVNNIENLSRITEIKTAKASQLNYNMANRLAARESTSEADVVSSVINKWNSGLNVENYTIGVATAGESQALASTLLGVDISKMPVKTIYRQEVYYSGFHANTIAGQTGLIGEVRQYRTPQFKPSLNIYQSNFEIKLIYQTPSGARREANILNGHLIIK